MTEQPDPNDPTSWAKFTISQRGDLRILRVQYRGCAVSLSFPSGEPGLLAANNLAESFPDIWKAALTEMGITDAMSDFDKELDELLGGDADE